MKYLPLILLASLIACKPSDLKPIQSNDGAAIVDTNPCGIPAEIQFDPRLIEEHFVDKINCVQQGSACIWQNINTHKQVLKFGYNSSSEIDQTFLNKSKLKIQLLTPQNDMQFPSQEYDATVFKGDQLTCYVDGDGPYSCSGAYFVTFHSSEELATFKTKCLVK
jgi:hypothetical protein